MALVRARRLKLVRFISARAIALAALASAGLVIAGIHFELPLWAIGVLAVVPLLLPLCGSVALTASLADGWLALFLVLVVTQLAHVGEHVAQEIQLRVLQLPAAQAHGIVGALDIEWVHFLFNGWVAVGIAVLLTRYAANRWLWLALGVSVWHLLEHTVIMATYLTTGAVGTPGLLASGGLIGGGLPIARSEMHTLYNLVETAPLVLALIRQWPRSVRAPVPARLVRPS
jgi:hypothetical protein